MNVVALSVVRCRRKNAMKDVYFGEEHLFTQHMT